MSLAVSQLGQRNPDKANELPSHCAVPLPWESRAPAQKWVGWAVPRGGRAIPPAARLPAAGLVRGVTLLAAPAPGATRSSASALTS